MFMIIDRCWRLQIWAFVACDMCKETCVRSLGCTRRRVLLRALGMRASETRACDKMRVSPGLLGALAIHASVQGLTAGGMPRMRVTRPFARAFKRGRQGTLLLT